MALKLAVAPYPKGVDHRFAMPGAVAELGLAAQLFVPDGLLMLVQRANDPLCQIRQCDVDDKHGPSKLYQQLR